MYDYKIPVSLFSDFRICRITDRFGTKGFGAVVRLLLHMAAQKDCCIEMLPDVERELAAFCGVSHGLMFDIIAYGKKLGLFRLKEEGTSFYLACPILENPASKKDENRQPLLKVTQNPKNESETGQILISEGCAEIEAAAVKKEKKNQKKKEDINNNLLNKLPYGESKVVYLTETEYQKLLDRFGEKVTLGYIEKLENYAGVFPKRFADYASHYRAILTWARRDAEKKENRSAPAQNSGYVNVRCLN